MSSAALSAMLRARSIAVVGASPRPGTLGARMVDQVTRSSGERRIHLVNPRYDSIAGRPCLPSLHDVPQPIDLALLGVGDSALVEQLKAAADAGVRSAVIFASAHGRSLRESLREIATGAGMAVCGAGCMGFANVADGLRALGYIERDELPRGPIAAITHSGSVFSALLRTRRALGFTIAVSSGQELVTTTADYLEHVLDETDTRVIGLVLETVRDGSRLVSLLRRAAAADIPVVLLPIGGSPLGSALVTAHSGALAGTRGMWEALAHGSGALLVDDLAELTDTLELLAIGRRARTGAGIATVHDSGAERTLVADLAHDLGVPFAPLGPATRARLDELLDEGLVAENPLDLWGSGADTRTLFAASLRAMADDPNVSAVALAVDLVPEYDGDTAYPDAAIDAHGDKPLVVLANLPGAIDQTAAARLRAARIPVLEGTRSGLVALKHLLALATARPQFGEHHVDTARRRRWTRRLEQPRPLDGVESLALLADYAVPVVNARAAASEDDVALAACELGYPVVLKTDEPGIAHKSDLGGVVLGLADEAAVRAAYRDLAARLGRRVLVCATAAAGVELALGVTRDPQLGALVVIAAGGVLAELVADRVVVLPPVSPDTALELLQRLRVAGLLRGYRGAAAADLAALAAAVSGLGELAIELGDRIAALDVNPVVAAPGGCLAVDALVVTAT